MKKVRAMLAGIAVLAVVGGAFAFKAKNAVGVNLYYTYTTAGAQTCSLELVGITTSAVTPGSRGLYYTFNSDGVCVPNVTVTTKTDD